ncbi:universal stress protein [Wenzhouxiangella sp. EGI_FJ10409]|uniref:universal stress protein n=1 Tax=Wenzhouxiangella sp. EGI_FJ10409 TaxID=3243767 RepID=UPI0035D90C45
MSKTAYTIPADGRIMACVDASIYADSVIDHAAWASKRLDAALVCLHVLDRETAHSPTADYSGNIGIDTQSALLEELAELDAQRSRAAMRQGRSLLERATKRAVSAGAIEPEALQRHGSLVETATELEDDVRLFVIGKRGESVDFNKGHLGANLERTVRGVNRPLLVTSRKFRPIERFAIAFDGSATTRKCVEMVCMSPLLKGLACHLIVAGSEDDKLRESLGRARQELEAAGFEPRTVVQPGDAEQVIIDQVGQLDIDLLVMGAYGHSRIRHLIVGSTTTSVLRSCMIPVLLLR